MPKKEKVIRILNCIPSADTENDWTVENALESGALTVSKNPDSIDLRKEWWHIGDQGNTGSCVGWATADSVLRWHLVKDNRITDKELLSVRYIWMAAKETDEFMSRPTTFIESAGTSLKAALDVARKFGCVKDSVLPFDPCTLYQKSAFTFYSLAAQLKIAGYFNLGSSLIQWRDWLANNGPILTRLGVDATWDKATDTHGKLDVYKPDTQRGGHAIALVGYTPEHFIVRNSWGTEWGDKGFAYASESYASEAFTEAYGVMM